MNNKKLLLIQTLIWISLWLLFAFSTDIGTIPGFYLISFIKLLSAAVYFNVIYFWLLPFYFSDRKRQFWVLSALVFIGFIVSQILIDWYFISSDRIKMDLPVDPPSGPRRPMFMVFIPQVFIGVAIFGIAAATKAFAAFETKKQLAEEENRRRLEAEIALLKSQINPHFLLNTLNNLYTLSLTDNVRTAPAIYKLSEMMRYILYDCTNPKVSVKNDINFIENYLNLQQLRLAPNVNLIISLPDNINDQLMIEPMILIPFIENTFKHGITTKENCDISISIQLEQDRLYMEVKNKIYKSGDQKIEASGMGIINTRQRLEHSYERKYDLKITERNDCHLVLLNMDLS